MTVSVTSKNAKIGQGLQATKPEYHHNGHFPLGLHVESGNDRYRETQNEEIKDDTCTRLRQVEFSGINHLMALASPRSTYRIVLKNYQLLTSVYALCNECCRLTKLYITPQVAMMAIPIFAAMTNLGIEKILL